MCFLYGWLYGRHVFTSLSNVWLLTGNQAGEGCLEWDCSSRDHLLAEPGECSQQNLLEAEKS